MLRYYSNQLSVYFIPQLDTFQSSHTFVKKEKERDENRELIYIRLIHGERERGRDRWPFIQRLAYHKRMANEHTF